MASPPLLRLTPDGPLTGAAAALEVEQLALGTLPVPAATTPVVSVRRALREVLKRPDFKVTDLAAWLAAGEVGRGFRRGAHGVLTPPACPLARLPCRFARACNLAD